MSTSLCPLCAAPLPAPKGGQLRRWCSDACRLEAVRERRRLATQVAEIERELAFVAGAASYVVGSRRLQVAGLTAELESARGRIAFLAGEA